MGDKRSLPPSRLTIRLDECINLPGVSPSLLPSVNGISVGLTSLPLM